MAAYRIVNTTILSDPNYTTSQDVTGASAGTARPWRPSNLIGWTGPVRLCQ
jgi:hypothetical protein